MIMKNIITIILVGFGWLAYGQQLPQYSQYSRNQFMINPAAAGMYDFVDLTIGGRYQWVGFDNAPKTAFAYGAAVLKRKNTLYNPSVRTSAGSLELPKVNTGNIKHAVGGQIIADEYGAFRRLSFSGTYAIHLPISDKMNMSFGTKLGLSSNNFLQERAVLLSATEGYQGPVVQDQAYDNFTGNQSPVNFMDIGMGFYVYSDQLFVGAAVDGLTKDMISFGAGTANYDPRMHINFTGGYKIPLNEDFALMPSVLAKMVVGTPLSVDATVQLEYQKRMWFGASYRHGDAIVAMLGMSISEKFKFGYSFDYSTTRFNRLTSGGHELVLGIMLGR